jgi:choline dehydrogenase
MTSNKRFDYVVVGSGSAGCAVAGRLAEDPSVSVCLVEAGPPSTGRLFDIPALFSEQLKTHFDWDLQTEPEPAMGGRRAYLPRGRSVGGSSSMNNMLYVRGNRADYDDWATMGHRGWAYSDVLPYFMRSEDNQSLRNEYHATGGPLTVSDPVAIHPALDAWIEAAVSMGYEHNADLNGAKQDGFGRVQVTQRRGIRCSSARAFVEPAGENLTLLHSTLALRIRFEGERAVGLLVDRAGEVFEIGVEEELIVSAGAYMSPHLLLQSGIGDPAQLAEHGIATVRELPGVGRNLRDHFGCFISFLSDSPPILGAYTAEDEEQLRNEGTGPMAWSEVSGFVRSSLATDRPDVQLHAGLGIVRDEGLAAALEHGICWGPYVGRPESVGAVTLRHSTPYSKPRIEHAYLNVESDRVRLRDGIRIAMAFARQPEVQRHITIDLAAAGAMGLAPASDTDEAIDDYLATAGFSFYHPVGSCEMGQVVDDSLRVIGLDNVRVADTSVMPTHVGANTNAPAIMIGERAAAFIKNEAPLS